jgi:hypothetical protein
MFRDYNPLKRENDQFYLITQAMGFIKLYQIAGNTNAPFYACLDCRIALEINDLHQILLSVPEEEHEEILENCRPRHGITKVDKGVGVLKERYQLYFQALNEVISLEGYYAYDFKKSRELQGELSKLIHSYWMIGAPLDYYSQFLDNAVELVKETETFIYSTTKVKGDKATRIGLRIDLLLQQDKALLEDWKTNSKMTYDELKARLMERQRGRR